MKNNNKEITMKKQILAGVVLAMLAACSPQEEAPKTVALETDTAKLGYAIGLDVGQSLKGLGGNLDRAAFIEAVNAQLDGATSRVSAEEAAKIKQEFFQKRAAKQAEERNAKGEANKVAGEKFLAENAKKDGVTVTASGLQYEVITMGDGAKPTATDKVKVHYSGTLLDGTEFDSSYKRGQPISFPLNGVIPGWTEGVQLMPVGSKFKFYIPSALAYGANGAGAAIAPNSMLTFEVELLAIETAEAVAE